MATYKIRRPLYVDDARNGDLVILGVDGDHPADAAAKLSASWATLPKGLTHEQAEAIERGWPKGKPVEPRRWHVGVITATRYGQPTHMRDMSGTSLILRHDGYVRWAQRDRFPDPEVALAFAAVAPTFLGACDVLYCQATLSPRPHPQLGLGVYTEEEIER